MIAVMDVQYHDQDRSAIAACVLFKNWEDAVPVREWTVPVEEVAEYVPGQFYKRELPCLMQLLQPVLLVPRRFQKCSGARVPSRCL